MNKFMAKSQCDRCGEAVATDLGQISAEVLQKQGLDSLPQGWAVIEFRGKQGVTHLCDGCAKRAVEKVKA